MRAKKVFIYISILLHIAFIGYFEWVYAGIWDIGHWRDNTGGQIPGTAFSGFNYNQEIRNDGIYTKPSGSVIELDEAGDYLIIATTRDNDTSNGRYNPQLRLNQTAGTWDFFTSYYTWYSRDNSEDDSWTRAIGVVVWASADSRIEVQKRRDTDAPTWGSIVNESDVQVIRLSQTNYGIYQIAWTGNAYGGITANTVDVTSVVSESDVAAIEGNIGTDTITLKGDNKKYLIAWSVSFAGTGNRTQRIWHLDYDGVDKLSTRSYCYRRNNSNEYCGLGSMDIVETSTADIALQTEIFRWPWVAVDQGWASSDQSMTTDWNGQLIVLEMPDYLEAFSSEDSVGLQDVTAPQTLNIARDVLFNDALSFTKNSDTSVSVTNPADVFSWSNIWTARSNVASGARQTSYGSIVIDGVEQTTWRHWNYSRWNQGSTDTFALSFHPAGIFTTTWAGSTIGVNSDPLAGWEAGWNDRTQPGTLWFFALNLDTFIAPELDQSSYRFYSNTNSSNVGAPLATQNTAITLSSDNEAFRLRHLISITNNKLRLNEKNLKLQFAQRVGTCDINFTGETYIDVDVSSAIAFNDNAAPNDEDLLTVNANDPVNGATPVVAQSYQEANNFTTSVAQTAQDQDALWDFSLIDNAAPNGTTYCFRIVESDGTLLDTYSFIPEITTFTPPSPGGVVSNLQIWLKWDAGTSTTTDGAALTTWNDQSGNGFNATAVTAPIYRNNTTDSLNYNPVIDFNGSTQYMQNLNDGAYTQSYFMVIVPDNTIDGTVTWQVPVGFDCNSGTLSSGTCWLTFAGTVLGSFTVALPDEVITHALGSSANWRAAQNWVASYTASKPMLVVMNENAGATNTDIYEKWIKVDSVTTNTYQSLSDADYTLGRSPDATYPFYYDGKIAEVINYSSRISDADRNKIESYLSIKYGITLNNGTQNYIASDGSTNIWTTAAAGSYTSNIFGIWRDDLSQLSQVQSTSINDGAIITLEALWEWTNQSPAFTDISDKEFLSISHENGSNAWSATDAPATYSVLARKWKVQEVGDLGTVRLDFDVADTTFNVPALNAGTNYYFVYDSDNDWNLNDETPSSMTNISGDIWRISGINLSHDQIFTLATEAGANNIPTDISISSSDVDENVVDGSTVWTLSTTDADPWDTHTYSLVSGTWDADNNLFTIVWNALNINYSPDYEIKNSYSVRIQTDDGNGGTYQESINISVNNLLENPTTIIDFEDISDEEKYTVTSGNWSRTTTNPQEWSRSLESNNGGANNTQSCFEVTHDMHTAGSIEFQYNVSSQWWSDFLHFYIDNVEQQTWSGNVPWTLYSTGTLATWIHTYKWCYIKDGGGSAGTDNAFIDYITFPSITEPILAVTKTDNDPDNTVLTNQIVRYTITLNNTWANWSGISITDAIDTDYGAPYNFTYNNCGSPTESFTAPTLTFSSVSVAWGNSCVITYDLQVDSWATSGSTITNSADASAATEWWNNPTAVTADTLTVLSCTNNNVSIVFETDGFWEDTFWSLVPNGNACGVWEIANGWNPNLTCASGGAQSANAADGYADNSTITEGPYSLTVWNQYDLHVIDDWWDGISATDPDVRIQQNWSDSNTYNVTGNGWVFTFTVQEPAGCTDTINPSVTVNQAPSQVDPTNSDLAVFKVAFDEPINTGTFTSADITLAGTTGTVTAGPTEVAPNNGTSFEFSVTGMTDGDTVTASIGAGLIEDTSWNTNNASTSIDNQVTYDDSDSINPSITSISFASGSLLPGGTHDIFIEYNDAESWIDTSSDSIALYKWNGSSWWSDIAATGLDLWAKTITSTGANYPMNNLNFWRYRYDFSISDNTANSSSTGAIFYIDRPEMLISTGSIDIGHVDNFSQNFSDTVTVTVRTVWAAFNVKMNRTSTFSEWWEDIPSWNGTNGYGYDPAPFSGSISEISTDQIIANEAANLNIDGNLNTYTYDFRIWALTEEFRSAGDYIWDLEFWIELNY